VPPGRASTTGRYQPPAQPPTGITSQERRHSMASQSIHPADLGELPAQPYLLRISARPYPGPQTVSPCGSKTEKSHHNGGIFGGIDTTANLCECRSPCQREETDRNQEKRSAVSAHCVFSAPRGSSITFQPGLHAADEIVVLRNCADSIAHNKLQRTCFFVLEVRAFLRCSSDTLGSRFTQGWQSYRLFELIGLLQEEVQLFAALFALLC
jgi:hypothetical protein